MVHGNASRVRVAVGGDFQEATNQTTQGVYWWVSNRLSFWTGVDKSLHNSDIKERIGRKIVEEAQEFCPEVNFLEYVDVIKGLNRFFRWHIIPVYSRYTYDPSLLPKLSQWRDLFGRSWHQSLPPRKCSKKQTGYKNSKLDARRPRHLLLRCWNNSIDWIVSRWSRSWS